MNAILQYIIQYAPVIVALLSEVAVVVTIFKKVSDFVTEAKDTIKKIKEDDEYNQLKVQLREVVNENRELKKQIDVLFEKVTKVKKS